jgi:DNA topoisomerase-1
MHGEKSPRATRIRSLVRMKAQLPAPESAKLPGSGTSTKSTLPASAASDRQSACATSCPSGKRVPAAELARIKALVIPPAWTDVWICPDARGHLQATGRDARGRKQYRYHPRWREVRDEAKYGG